MEPSQPMTPPLTPPQNPGPVPSSEPMPPAMPPAAPPATPAPAVPVAAAQAPPEPHYVIAPPPPDTIAQIAAQPHATPDITTNEIYATICSQIIKEQGQIIGALTYEQASHVPGLTVDPTSYTCVINGDGNSVLEQLVNKYREFFGNAAVEVCREAAARFASRLPNEQMPAVLRV